MAATTKRVVAVVRGNATRLGLKNLVAICALPGKG